MKKTVFLFATAILVTFSACNNFQTTAKLSDDLDSLNYALGLASGANFKRAFGEDTTKAAYNLFLKGFNKGFDSVPETELEKANAILAGIQLKEALKENFIFGDSAFIANKKLIEKTVFDVLAGKDSIYGFTGQSAQQYYFKISRQQHDTIKHELTAEQLDSLNVAFAVMQGSRTIARVDSAKKADFVKNYKKGYRANALKKYYYNGLINAAQGYNMFKGGLGGDASLKLNTTLLKAGFNAGLLGDTTIFTPEKAMLYYQTTIVEKLFGKNRIAGEEFLAENAKREGVQVTESGLQYEVVREGKGAKPTAQDTVIVEYEGMLLDSTIFDSSYKRRKEDNKPNPLEIPANHVIAGWTEGLQLMSVGSEYKFYIPYNLAYGEQGSQTINPFSTLIFKVELVGIKKFIPQATIQNQSLNQ